LLGKKKLWLSDITAREPSLHDGDGSERFALVLSRRSIHHYIPSHQCTSPAMGDIEMQKIEDEQDVDARQICFLHCVMPTSDRHFRDLDPEVFPTILFPLLCFILFRKTLNLLIRVRDFESSTSMRARRVLVRKKPPSSMADGLCAGLPNQLGFMCLLTQHISVH
jgi:hypothetical protein